MLSHPSSMKEIQAAVMKILMKRGEAVDYPLLKALMKADNEVTIFHDAFLEDALLDMKDRGVIQFGRNFTQIRRPRR